MSATHTPGPWHVSPDGNDIEAGDDGPGVCALYADESADANARLIAKAPELRDVADLFCYILEHDYRAILEPQGLDWQYTRRVDLDSARRKTRALLAEIDGKDGTA